MDNYDKIGFVLVLSLILCILLLIGSIYDFTYCSPVASDKANSFCKSNGFDQYKDFSRVGICSKTPIAIKCEYAEKYTDLGVRSNSG